MEIEERDQGVFELTSFAALHMKLELRDSAVLVADKEPLRKIINQHFWKKKTT